MNKLAEIYYKRECERKTWFNEYQTTYISFYYKGKKYEYQVRDKCECLNIIRDKLDELLND